MPDNLLAILALVVVTIAVLAFLNLVSKRYSRRNAERIRADRERLYGGTGENAPEWSTVATLSPTGLGRVRHLDSLLRGRGWEWEDDSADPHSSQFAEQLEDDDVQWLWRASATSRYPVLGVNGEFQATVITVSDSVDTVSVERVGERVPDRVSWARLEAALDAIEGWGGAGHPPRRLLQ